MNTWKELIAQAESDFKQNNRNPNWVYTYKKEKHMKRSIQLFLISFLLLVPGVVVLSFSRDMVIDTIAICAIILGGASCFLAISSWKQGE